MIFQKFGLLEATAVTKNWNFVHKGRGRPIVQKSCQRRARDFESVGDHAAMATATKDHDRQSAWRGHNL